MYGVYLEAALQCLHKPKQTVRVATATCRFQRLAAAVLWRNADCLPNNSEPNSQALGFLVSSMSICSFNAPLQLNHNRHIIKVKDIYLYGNASIQATEYIVLWSVVECIKDYLWNSRAVGREHFVVYR